MKTIILGREGNQPFPIKKDSDGVSRQHAKITITDNQVWYIEDLDSSNGTYIRNEDTGELKPVTGKKRISPMTFICLGPDNSRGCCFFAKQADQYGDYTEEREYLVSKMKDLDSQLENVEQMSKNLTLVKTVLPFALFGVSMLIIPGEGTIQMLIKMAASAIPSALIQIFYNDKTKKKEIKEMRERFSHCPNPCCSNKQTSKEILNLRCSKCKK